MVLPRRHPEVSAPGGNGLYHYSSTDFTTPSLYSSANLLPVYFFSIEGQDIASSVFALAHFSFIGINLLAQGFLVRSVYKHHLLADKEAHPRRRYWFGAATVVLAGAMLFATGKPYCILE